MAASAEKRCARLLLPTAGRVRLGVSLNQVRAVIGSSWFRLVSPFGRAPLARVVSLCFLALSKPVQPHQKPSQKISGFHYWYNVVGKKPFEGLRCTSSKVATLV